MCLLKTSAISQSAEIPLPAKFMETRPNVLQTVERQDTRRGERKMAKTNRSATMGRLHSAARLARTALAARLLSHGFYAGQDQIMLALYNEDGQTPGQLAMRIGVRPPTITKTINRLQSQGFLDKQASDKDARQAHIFLTETGRDAIRNIEKSVRKTEKAALKGLDKRDQKALAKLLAKVEANLSDIAYQHEEEDEDQDD
jgi:DNA-binding MarR family transcriptional regulator